MEFTGERVIPGQVDINLWNEHIARYAFAARLCENRRVLDAGCGTGYGTAELAKSAAFVAGIDLAPDALGYAQRTYSGTNLTWVGAAASALPFTDASFDLVVTFEVIEHLADWPAMVREARRVMTQGAQFLVSTPNRSFYAETRRESGPNPYHVHEFDFDEFRAALLEYFPYVSVFLEDHTEGVLFRTCNGSEPVDVRIERHDGAPVLSNFFLALCSMTPQTDAPTFLYVPSAANLLGERSAHIHRLEAELRTKNEWLANTQAEHQKLVELFRSQTRELEGRNQWAQHLNDRLSAAGDRIAELQQEVTDLTSGYEAKIAELHRDIAEKTAWARDIDTRLTVQTDELTKCVGLLDTAESLVEERTRWALQLQNTNAELERRLNFAAASRWVRLGRMLGMGPELRNV
jgi:SAM-dependent methyltransferase